MGSGSANNSASPPPPRPVHPQPPSNVLPELGELAARIEEAKNSAKLLTQFVQTTPLADVETNDLIKEFVDRCRTSSRLIQSYIHATNPSPDEETLLTLIETNDEISVALSQQQRAMLKARKARGSSTPSSSQVNSPSPPTGEVMASGAGRPGSVSAPQGSRNIDISAPLINLSPTTTSDQQNPSRTNTEQYQYDSASFEVRNPFADDYAANSSTAERYGQNGNSSSIPDESRARFQ